MQTSDEQRQTQIKSLQKLGNATLTKNLQELN